MISSKQKDKVVIYILCDTQFLMIKESEALRHRQNFNIQL